MTSHARAERFGAAAMWLYACLKLASTGLAASLLPWWSGGVATLSRGPRTAGTRGMWHVAVADRVVDHVVDRPRTLRGLEDTQQC